MKEKTETDEKIENVIERIKFRGNEMGLNFSVEAEEDESDEPLSSEEEAVEESGEVDKEDDESEVIEEEPGRQTFVVSIWTILVICDLGVETENEYGKQGAFDALMGSFLNLEKDSKVGVRSGSDALSEGSGRILDDVLLVISQNIRIHS